MSSFQHSQQHVSQDADSERLNTSIYPPGRSISTNAEALAQAVVTVPNEWKFRDGIKAIIRNGGEDSFHALAAVILEASKPDSQLSQLLYRSEPEILGYLLSSALLKVAGSKHVLLWKDIQPEHSLSRQQQDEAEGFVYGIARGDYLNPDYMRGARIALAETTYGSFVGRNFLSMASVATSFVYPKNDLTLFFFLADLPWVLSSKVPWACSSHKRADI